MFHFDGIIGMTEENCELGVVTLPISGITKSAGASSEKTFIFVPWRLR